jgi:molybdenum cofactor synthesis domain-containing protein
MIKVGILTLSDTRSIEPSLDLSGQKIKEIIKEINGSVEYYHVIPDDESLIKKELIKMSDELKLDLILTTGGTGLAPKDLTPESTLAVIDKEVPGISEAIRRESFKYTRKAMLSRGVAGFRKRTLIINLPGSPKAVKESLEIILSVIPHAVNLLNNDVKECART